MSDPILAYEIGESQREDELRRGGMRIVPNTLRSYGDPSSIPVYFEIYNLTYTPQGSTQFSVDYKIESKQTGSGVRARIPSIFGRASSGRVATSFEYQGDRSTESMVQTMALESAQTGEFELTIQVVDRNTGQQVSRKQNFYIH